jgi:hypothetical protein
MISKIRRGQIFVESAQRKGGSEDVREGNIRKQVV